MGKGVTSSKFVEEFCKRVKLAREFRGYTQGEIAKELGMTANSWSKYEFRTLLPHRYMARVCELLQVSADYFYASKLGRSAEQPQYDPHPQLPPSAPRLITGRSNK